MRRRAPLRLGARFGERTGGRDGPARADGAEAGQPVEPRRAAAFGARRGLLRATRGSGGGLKLARPAAAITLADIVEAVEGPIALTSCVEQGRHDCALEPCCSVRPHWGVVNETLRGALAGVPLTQLAQPQLAEVAP